MAEKTKNLYSINGAGPTGNFSTFKNSSSRSGKVEKFPSMLFLGCNFFLCTVPFTRGEISRWRLSTWRFSAWRFEGAGPFARRALGAWALAQGRQRFSKFQILRGDDLKKTSPKLSLTAKFRSKSRFWGQKQVISAYFGPLSPVLG